MRIKLKRTFRYQVSATKTGAILPGEHDVPKDVSFDLAAKAMKFGGAKIVPDKPKPEKKAPENKVVYASESKSEVEVKPMRRRSTRTKPNK